MNGKSKSFKRRTEPELDGRFECQPEYRKAYIDYLVREKKPPLIPKKRISELFDNVEKSETSATENVRLVTFMY